MVVPFLAGLLYGHFPFLVLLGADELVGVELLEAGKVGFGLAPVDFGQAYAALGGVERTQFGNDLHLGYHFALLHLLAGFLVDFFDDARYLRLDEDFVSRLYLAGDDGGLLQVGHGGADGVVEGDFGLGLLVQEHEGPDEDAGHDDQQRDFQNLSCFHVDMFFCFYFYNRME